MSASSLERSGGRFGFRLNRAMSMAMLVAIFGLGAGMAGGFVAYVVEIVLRNGSADKSFAPAGFWIGLAVMGIVFGVLFCGIANAMVGTKTKLSLTSLAAFAALACYCGGGSLWLSSQMSEHTLDPILPWSALSPLLIGVVYFLLANAIAAFALWRGLGVALSPRMLASTSVLSLLTGLAAGASGVSWLGMVLVKVPLWGIAMGAVVAFHLPAGASHTKLASDN